MIWTINQTYVYLQDAYTKIIREREAADKLIRAREAREKQERERAERAANKRALVDFNAPDSQQSILNKVSCYYADVIQNDLSPFTDGIR